MRKITTLTVLTMVCTAAANGQHPGKSSDLSAPSFINKSAYEYEMEMLNARKETPGNRIGESLRTNIQGIANSASEQGRYRPLKVTTHLADGTNLYLYEYLYDRNGTDYPEVGPMVQYFRQWNPATSEFVKMARWMVVPDESNNVAYYYQDEAENDHWTNSYRFKGTYDADGNELSGTKEYWENNEWVARVHWDSEYSPEGLIISQKFRTMGVNDPDWVEGAQYEWGYENGFLVRYVSRTKADGTYVNTIERRYTNDTEGRVLTMTQLQLDKNVFRERYSYDNNGMSVDFISERWNEETGIWGAQTRVMHEYDTEGRMISEVKQISAAGVAAEDTEWTNNSKSEFMYTPDKLVETGYNYKQDEESWTPYTRKTSYFNSHGDITAYETATLNPNTGEFETRAETVWEYDDDNNLLSYKSENVFGENRTVSGAYTYTYENGNAVTANYEKKGYRETVTLPYNNMNDTWVGKYDFTSMTAQAEYLDITSDIVVPESIEFGMEELTLTPEESVRIQPTIKPENAHNKEVHWISSNENVVRVDVDGNVTGLAEGEANIKAVTIEGLIEAELPVKVTGISGVESVDADKSCSIICGNGTIIITGEGIENVTVFGIAGDMKAMHIGDTPFDTTSWEKGIYIVKVIQNGKAKVCKAAVL